jgi:cyanophycinase-like exopeptidase
MDIMTKLRQRHSKEQIVRKIQDADRILAEGGDVSAVVRELTVPQHCTAHFRSEMFDRS